MTDWHGIRNLDDLTPRRSAGGEVVAYMCHKWMAAYAPTGEWLPAKYEGCAEYCGECVGQLGKDTCPINCQCHKDQ